MVTSSVVLMPETLDDVSERLTRLEVTVAEGFHDARSRFHDAELRDMALSRKIDVNTESLRSDLRTVLAAVASLGDEMRRTTDAIRQEHAADRTVLTLAIEEHARRLHDLEGLARIDRRSRREVQAELRRARR